MWMLKNKSFFYKKKRKKSAVTAITVFFSPVNKALAPIRVEYTIAIVTAITIIIINYNN